MAAGKVALEVAMYPCPKEAVQTAVVFNARGEYTLKRIGVFNAFAGIDPLSPNRLTALPDTGADITMISPSAIDPSWDKVSVPGVSVTGVGGLAPDLATTAVKVPIRLQWGSTLIYIYA